jgi:hypothetical protein
MPVQSRTVRTHFTADDGIRLAGLLYVSRHTKRRPTVVALDPYRNQTAQRLSNDALGTWCCKYGYNFLILDARGTGASSGVAIDEYDPQEPRDLLAAIRELATRRWSDGDIVLYGVSYSGFVAIRTCWLAAREPDLLGHARLRSAFVCYASDDRLNDDIHWWGGVKTIMDWTWYATAMTAINRLPLSKVRHRQQAPPWTLRWLDPTNHKYWYATRPAASEVPLFLYAGLHDIYGAAAFRIHRQWPRNLTVVGRIGHSLPDNIWLWLKWWLHHGTTLRSKLLFCQADKKWFQVDSFLPEADWKWRGSAVLRRELVCGPILRHAPTGLCGPMLRELRRAGIEFRVPLFSPTVGAPTIDVEAASAEPFYLVAWLLNGSSGYIHSTGVGRSSGIGRKKAVRIEMAALAVTEPYLLLFFTTSSLPSLLPQILGRGTIELRRWRVRFSPVRTRSIPESKLFPDRNATTWQFTPTVERLRFIPQSGIFELRTHQTDCQRKNRRPKECLDEAVDVAVRPGVAKATFTDRAQTADGVQATAVTTIDANDSGGTFVEIHAYGPKKGPPHVHERFSLPMS